MRKLAGRSFSEKQVLSTLLVILTIVHGCGKNKAKIRTASKHVAMFSINRLPVAAGWIATFYIHETIL